MDQCSIPDEFIQSRTSLEKLKFSRLAKVIGDSDVRCAIHSQLGMNEKRCLSQDFHDMKRTHAQAKVCYERGGVPFVGMDAIRYILFSAIQHPAFHNLHQFGSLKTSPSSSRAPLRRSRPYCSTYTHLLHFFLHSHLLLNRRTAPITFWRWW